MEENQNGMQVNPNYVIEELVSKNAELNMENAKYRALIRELSEQQNQEDNRE